MNLLKIFIVIGNITSNTMTTYSNDWETLLINFNFKKFISHDATDLYNFNNLKYKEKFCHRVIKILLGVSFTLAMLLMIPDPQIVV